MELSPIVTKSTHYCSWSHQSALDAVLNNKMATTLKSCFVSKGQKRKKRQSRSCQTFSPSFHPLHQIFRLPWQQVGTARLWKCGGLCCTLRTIWPAVRSLFQLLSLQKPRPLYRPPALLDECLEGFEPWVTETHFVCKKLTRRAVFAKGTWLLMAS